jgi:CheY-like chemotaxis protein/two-component sensor histidine kinase
MARQVAHITRLIDDLLDMSRIDRGSLELRRERVAINSVVTNAVETIKPKFEQKQQELVLSCPSQRMYVDGDPVRLCQILLNLLANASKYTPHGGRVEVATDLDDDEVVIAVTDNGIGLAEEDHRRIFDMFVQLDASKTQSTTGLGLGLAIARSLVEKHDGRIDVQSDGQGKGATFTVRLPKVSGPDAGPARSDPLRTAGRRRIIVVDDNVDAAHLLAQMLRLHGHDVQAAYDGRQGLEAAREFKPEIAFIDLNMPRMDGLDLAKALRGEQWAAGMRLIALTGMGQGSDIESTRAAGFDAHLTKPASVEDILRFAGTRDGQRRAAPVRSGREPMMAKRCDPVGI